MVAKKLPTIGKHPANIMITAPVMIVNLFTTLVMAISPTFCEKDVTGGHPKRADTDDIYPSDAIEPDISLSFTSRFRPPDTIADVSPIVSAAETKNITITDRIGPILNSGVNIRKSGIDVILLPLTYDKSTIPRLTATIYPTIIATRTESAFRYPFIETIHMIETRSVIVPTIRFSGEPKSSV